MEKYKKNNNINLGKEKYELKKYASFGMIDFTEHAKKRMRERGITPIDVFEYLTAKNCTIAQYKEIGTYNNNKPRFVMCGKINKKPLHIVIEKMDEKIPRYEVVTVYEPSQQYFSHNGMIVKKAKNRNKKTVSY